ncbi:hypothetical protein PC120_g25722 [Phytophthora cactorum]|nr:hypothetical protein PC120_g25722 [Phytophthora cactorum]
MNEPSLRGRAPTVELRRTTVTLKCSHPFVIPEDLVKSLTAALQTKNLEVQLNTGSKVCASSSTVLDVDASPEATKDLVVKFKSAGPMFSSSRVDAMMNFYQFKKNTVNWKSDVSWLKDDCVLSMRRIYNFVFISSSYYLFLTLQPYSTEVKCL